MARLIGDYHINCECGRDIHTTVEDTDDGITVATYNQAGQGSALELELDELGGHLIGDQVPTADHPAGDETPATDHPPAPPPEHAAGTAEAYAEVHPTTPPAPRAQRGSVKPRPRGAG